MLTICVYTFIHAYVSINLSMFSLRSHDVGLCLQYNLYIQTAQKSPGIRVSYTYPSGVSSTSSKDFGMFLFSFLPDMFIKCFYNANVSCIILTFYMKSHIPFSNYLNITSKLLEIVSAENGSVRP